MTIKKRYVRTDGWRGYYEPVPPEGWVTLADCQVVNESGAICRDIIAKWLRANKVRYRSGLMQTSNVFSMNMYIVCEDKISEELRRRIDNWFVDQTTATFSIMTGRSWSLDELGAQHAFDAIVSGY